MRVAVIEAPTKSFEGGIGYSTDVRYTAKASYRDVNVDGKGLQLLVDGAGRRQDPERVAATRAAGERGGLDRHLGCRRRSTPTSRAW